MQNYIYISDVKVDMFFSQIQDKEKIKIAGELGINLGVFKATLKGEETPKEANRSSKLKLILNSLEKQNKIGTIENSKMYFKGEADMCWGEFPDTGLIYFTGMIDDNTLGLGGSLKHVIGNEKIRDLQEKGGSRVAGIQTSLIEKLGLEPYIEKLRSENINEKKLGELEVKLAVEEAYERITGVYNKLEFVAIRLYEDKAEAPKTVLATPIYVARAE